MGYLVLWIALGILAFAAAVFAAFTAVSYFMVFYSPKKGQNDDANLPKEIDYTRYGTSAYDMVRAASSETYEELFITSRDGLKLRGRLYKRHGDHAPVAVGFHGYRGTPSRDFSGGLFSFLNMGCNVILAEQRGCGLSEGHTITFGIKERFDCVDWVKYAAELFPGSKIALFGISMGASTVLMASGDPELPENVKLICADCPFNRPGDIIKSVTRSMKLPAELAYIPIYAGARIFGRFDPSETSAEENVKKAKVPVVVIHGLADTFVPCEMSECLAEANPLCRRYTFPDAQHGVSFLEDRERYERIIADAARECGITG
ncbi:MAG: alpha/beta hydrolase [Clostridia bacterium]|nr:alpha/beta hydrolase [Clostridia bacterium]